LQANLEPIVLLWVTKKERDESRKAAAGRKKRSLRGSLGRGTPRKRDSFAYFALLGGRFVPARGGARSERG